MRQKNLPLEKLTVHQYAKSISRVERTSRQLRPHQQRNRVLPLQEKLICRRQVTPRDH